LAGVDNDPKQALGTKINPQIAVRSLIETISMRATTIYNSINNINKAASITTRLNNNSIDGNYTSGVNNVIQNEETKNSVNNSIDNIR
jgi:hypothetical protein